MSFLQKALAFSAVLASLGGVHAKLDVNAADNVVVYWGVYLAGGG